MLVDLGVGGMRRLISARLFQVGSLATVEANEQVKKKFTRMKWLLGI